MSRGSIGRLPRMRLPGGLTSISLPSTQREDGLGVAQNDCGMTHLRDTGEPKQTDVQQRPDGTVVVQNFPTTLQDRVLMPRVRGEAWLRPGVTPDTVKRGKNHRRRASTGRSRSTTGARWGPC